MTQNPEQLLVLKVQAGIKGRADNPPNQGPRRRRRIVMLKKLLSAGLVLAVIGLNACSNTTAPRDATLTKPQSVYQQFGAHLASAASIYEAVMQAAGEAHAQHLITDKQLASVVTAGQKVYDALTVTKSALSTYLQTADASIEGDLVNKFLMFDNLLMQLVQESRTAGIIK